MQQGGDHPSSTSRLPRHRGLNVGLSSEGISTTMAKTDIPVDLEDFAKLSRYTGFQYFCTMVTALGADTKRYQAECIKLKDLLSSQEQLTQEAYAELGFWYRGYARAFLIFVEGLLFVMRRLVCHAEERGEIDLVRGESHLIRETEYSVQGNRVNERSRPNRLIGNFTLTFRLFPQVFGSPFTVDYSNNGWEQFQRLVRFRNDLTHPKSAKDTLLHAELINTIRDAAAWFFQCMGSITSSADATLMERSYRDTVAMPKVQKLLRELGPQKK
jgi:hypothetical protein